ISSVFGWSWAFLINVPICAVLIFATLKVVPESRDPDAKGLDYAGIFSLSAGLFLLTWAVIDGNTLGWLAPAVLWRIFGGVVLLFVFVVVERRQNAYGFAPMTAGISMLPFALPMFLVPRLGARLTWPSRSVLSLGLSITVVGNALMALLSGASASYPIFAVAMIVAGTGAGILNGETAKALQSALPANRSGRMGLTEEAAIDLARRFSAGDAGSALAHLPGSLRGEVGTALRTAFESGFAAAAWVAVGVAAITLALTWLLMAGGAAVASSDPEALFVADE
nr:hypothetical protein [Tanacetum cinerariifolium]